MRDDMPQPNKVYREWEVEAYTTDLRKTVRRIVGAMVSSATLGAGLGSLVTYLVMGG